MSGSDPAGEDLKLALRLNLYKSATLDVPVDLVRAADDLGYHSVWSVEAYGADALSPLAYLAAMTTRIKLGTAIAQLAARPPATLAMHAMTIDAVPDEYLEQTAFIGDEQRIRRRWATWTPPAGVTDLIVDVPRVEELRLVANLKEGS
jgi:hypothetical protein